MLRKMSTSLFHHKYIGKYIAQKLRYAILYFFLLTFFMIIPSIMILTVDESIKRSEAETVEVLIRNNTGEATIENNKLEITLDYRFETDNYCYAFSNNNINSLKPTFLFTEYKLIYIYYGRSVNEMTYEELKVDSIIINSDSSYGEIEELISICEVIRKDSEIKTKVWEGFSSIFMIWVNYIITVVILFFVTKFGSSILTAEHRFIIAFYAVTSNIVCDFFALVTGLRFIQILGLVLSVLAAYRASKAIISIREI